MEDMTGRVEEPTIYWECRVGLPQDPPRVCDNTRGMPTPLWECQHLQFPHPEADPARLREPRSRETERPRGREAEKPRSRGTERWLGTVGRRK